MDNLNNDCIYKIMTFLSLNDSYHFSLTGQNYHSVFINEGRLWKHWCNNKFGNIEKNDILEKDPTWRMVYMEFIKLYTDMISYLDIIEKTKFKKIKQIVLNTYKTLLYRNHNHAMVIPYIIGKKLRIKPRNGDVIINLDRIGYRNEGVWIWNDDLHKRCGLNYEVDDYGSIPYDFSWPEYPIMYYNGIIQHNNLINLKIDINDVEYEGTGIFRIKCNKETIRISIQYPLSLLGFQSMVFFTLRYIKNHIVVFDLVKFENNVYYVDII
ncbi:hypothetical protein Indivirus_2_107 [Indivirus ILV1]|uniref:F-box domain-containing protein n=1 Tax=Indivirus ILV1 TaxID=1977633 RepID=A0A1V0SDJ7_9VIRU|nr:hypothetical protein Indivirus_2_107 [Indivirus ILV1]